MQRCILPVRTALSGIVFAALCAAALPAWGWGTGHPCITRVAITLLPAEDLASIGPERAAMETVYCKFPDMNWPCYGQWGGGVGDASLPRFPDTRREWEISYYCGWDPVLRVGKGYAHKPPESFEATATFFARAVAELKQGRREDAIRILGAMLHYVQDSGSFPHVQPVHRTFDVKTTTGVCPAGYQPQRLGHSPEEAAKAAAERVGQVVAWTERRIEPLWQGSGLTFTEAKKLAQSETLPGRVVDAWTKVRREKPADVEAAAVDCAGECARACADVIHTLLAFASTGQPTSSRDRPDNLVFNPSFEENGGDQVPAGWYVEFLDLGDLAGRAERYRQGTHWARHVHQGDYSVLILNAPAQGLQWRPTWRRAVAVNAGERYRGTAWAKTSKATGRTWLGLEFYDAAYHPLASQQSETIAGDHDWRQLSVETAAPENARWLRVILHSQDNRGAVWFDDVALQPLP